MSEEENKIDEVKEEVKEVGKEVTTRAKDVGAKFETTPIIERAREEREKMEVATAAQRVENDRAEAIAAKRELGGRAEAGGEKEKPKELSPEEYADQVMGNEKE